MFTSLNFVAGAFVMVVGGDLLREGYGPHPVAAPRVHQAPVPPQDSSRHRRVTQHTYNHVVQNGSHATEINFRGKVAFTEDERDIKSISPGGYFKFSKTTFGNTRSILIESSSDGTLTRTYHAGRQEQPYEPEGRKWLADMLPEIIATSGIGAEERVQRIYAKKGVNGVLETIDQLESDHASGVYLGYLLEQPNLGDKDLLKVLERVTAKIGSDHEKANLLRRVSGTYLRSNQTSQQYIRAVSSIGSDHEKSQVFKHVLGSLQLNDANTAAVTGAVATIGSDHEKAGVVRFLLQQHKLDGPGLQQVLPVIGSIGSDHEKAGVLRAMLGNQALTGTHFKTLAGLIDRVGSDHEKAGVIAHLVNTNQPLVQAHFAEVLGLVTRIGSDHEKGRTLAVLLAKTQPSDKQYVQVLAALPSIGSDHEKGALLTRLAKTLPRGNASVMDAYKKAAKSIGSDHEYRRAMEAIE
jgi:hypothetical protein